MKTLLSLGCALLVATSASAQIFRPGAVDGALIGGIAGAVIGHNSGSLHHNGWQGAAIGAGVGALLGAAADSHSAYYDHRPVAPGGGYIYRSRVGGSYARDGLWLGALGGGIIGHNRGFSHGRDGWRGAAWGAGAGWLLGSMLDANYGYYRSYDDYSYPRQVVVAAPPTVVVPAAPAAPAPQQVTIINNYYGNTSPMAGANSLFGR